MHTGPVPKMVPRVSMICPNCSSLSGGKHKQQRSGTERGTRFQAGDMISGPHNITVPTGTSARSHGINSSSMVEYESSKMDEWRDV